jgi:16S rRNA (guanine(966)-N(2))-methyltransferase RsmD
MRIIAGEFRRRVLLSPPDDKTTRPIPDRVKESVFSILRGHFEGATVFDGFAGTGAIGLEAVSRGASRCLLVEQDKAMSRLLTQNVERLGAGDRCEVLTADALGPGALARAPRPLHLAFLDPPYPLMRDPLGRRRIMAQLGALVDLLDPEGFAVLRTPWPLFDQPEPEDAEADDEPRPRKGRKPARNKRAAEEPEEEEEWFEADEIEELIEESDAEAAPESPAPESSPAHLKRNRPLADLTLPNAAGPETHLYRGMAVHLYAKKRAGKG